MLPPSSRPLSSAFSPCCSTMPAACRCTRRIRCSIAVPAMMIGHLAVAGLAEAVIAAGLVAYLQAADPALLQGTSGLADAGVC